MAKFYNINLIHVLCSMMYDGENSLDFAKRKNKIHANLIKNCEMSRIMRKPAFCICENKDADQFCDNCETDQHHCFCYMDSTISLLPKPNLLSKPNPR